MAIMNDPLSQSRRQFLGYAGVAVAFVPALGGAAEVEAGFVRSWANMAAIWFLQETDFGPLDNGSGDVTGLGDTDAGYMFVHGAPNSTITNSLS